MATARAVVDAAQAAYPALAASQAVTAHFGDQADDGGDPKADAVTLTSQLKWLMRHL